MLLGLFLAPRPAAAIPVFAHRYGLSCQTCHTTVPHLTEFGAAFRERGYQLPGAPRHGAFPVAVKVNLQYGSDAGAGPSEGRGRRGGAADGRLAGQARLVLRRAVRGGRRLAGAHARPVGSGWRATPDDARVPVSLRAGQFTLSLPADPETFRESPDHYAIWDQTAGANPFAFFAPKTGLAATLGDDGRGWSATLAAVQGHEPGSGLPARGIDRAFYVQHASAHVALSAYRYDGTRTIDGVDDRFWREGFGVRLERARAQFDAVYQHGFDTHATADGALRSSGGFAQFRYELAPRWFALARYDATQDTAFSRALTAGFGYRVARNARLTVFDTLHRDGDGNRRNTLTTALLFAY